MHLALGSLNTQGLNTPSPAAPDAALVAGIAAYRRHPYQRALADPPVLWSDGSSRLLDYGGDGPAILFVPSLVNRAYVLDLAPGRSMLRWLAARGVRPLLLDWGWPEATERHFTLSDYVALRLIAAMEALPGPVVLAGYCMGGLLALAAAQLRPDRVAALVLLATPWDFHAAPSALRSGTVPPLLPGGTLPVDAIQALFALQTPGAVAAKFRAFGRLDQAGNAARLFVAIEDWLADGVPLAAPVAQECLTGWYGENTPAKGDWRVGGQVIDPAALRLPALVALPANDRVVPPESAGPLAALIPGATRMELALGHVGMVTGSRAEAMLWRKLLDWLHGLKTPMSDTTLQ
jgi:polyhydroxyalkanoate synthase